MMSGPETRSRCASADVSAMPRPPRILARLDERPRIVVLPDGCLLGAFVRLVSGAYEAAARRSGDGGATWSEPERLVVLPRAPGAWGGCEALVDRTGELHLFLLNDRGTGVLADPAGEGEVKRLGLQDLRLDIWHLRTTGGRTAWRGPDCIWVGYTGALNSVVQTREGRLLLPFSYLTRRTWAERGEGLDAFWYAGQFTATVLWSDDGVRWQPSAPELKVQTPSIGLYGGCEPVVVERAEGRLWMLIRTQLGRFYESESADGATWTRPRPSPLLSSDSPAGLVRLTDGRLVLLWNKCLRFPYAHGGRHVLHAAVSADDGATWVGHREVARDPRRAEPPPPGGDFGTAYPFPVALPDDTVLVTTGQGEGRVVVVAIDPAWLLETRQRTAFAPATSGADLAAPPTPKSRRQRAHEASAAVIPDDWSAFGCRGVGLRADPADGTRTVLEVRRTEEEWPAAAAWNHPLGRHGRLSLQVRLHPGSAGARVLLTDHFSVPFDPEDAHECLFALRLTPSAQATSMRQAPAMRGEVAVAVEAGRWLDLEIGWDCEERCAVAAVGGGAPVTLPMRRLGDGVCYLRVKPVAEGVDAGFCVGAAGVTIGDDRDRQDPAR